MCIFLPKKAFKSFCTWMLLPTVLYTPSSVNAAKRRGGDKKTNGSVMWTNTEQWKSITCFSSDPAGARIKIQMFHPDYDPFIKLSLRLNDAPSWDHDSNYMLIAWVLNSTLVRLISLIDILPHPPPTQSWNIEFLCLQGAKKLLKRA